MALAGGFSVALLGAAVIAAAAAILAWVWLLTSRPRSPRRRLRTCAPEHAGEYEPAVA